MGRGPPKQVRGTLFEKPAPAVPGTTLQDEALMRFCFMKAEPCCTENSAAEKRGPREVI